MNVAAETMGSSDRRVTGANAADPRGAFTVWLTGLSGAGKSTIANIVVELIRERGRAVELLDGDVVRTNLSSELGFSRKDRDTNIRRIGWVCQLLNRNGIPVVVAAISPFRDARDEVRAQVPNFVEVHVDCPVAVLSERDVKGLYRRALAGEIQNFTGVSDPYEHPLNPELRFRTDDGVLPSSHAGSILEYLRDRAFVE